MTLTNEEEKFLVELLNDYLAKYNLEEEIYLNKNGELTQIWFDHKEHHNTEDIRAYKLIHGLLNKLY